MFVCRPATADGRQLGNEFAPPQSLAVSQPAIAMAAPVPSVDQLDQRYCDRHDRTAGARKCVLRRQPSQLDRHPRHVRRYGLHLCRQ